MSRNGSGQFDLLVNSWNPATNGVLATAGDYQALINDIAAALTQSVSKDGQTPMTGALNMGNNPINNVTAGSGTGQALAFEQLFAQGTQADLASAATTDIGLQNTNFLRITGNTTITSFGTNYRGPRFLVFAGAVTLTNSATLVLPGGANITTAAGDVLIAIPGATLGTADKWIVVACQAQGGTMADIASAATVDIGAQNTSFLRMTGTTTVTSFGTNYRGPRFITFEGAVLLTNSSTLVLPGGANITTAAGDSLIVIPGATAGTADKWIVVAYQSASGTAQSQLDSRTGTAGGLGFRNRLINANPIINQRGYVSGTATTTANQYTLDRWRVVTSGQNVSWTDSGLTRTVTCPAGGFEQVIESLNIEGGTFVLSWTGTATATVNGTAVVKNGTFTLPANTNATVRFSSGTLSNPQLEAGTVATPFERRDYGRELMMCQRYYTKSYEESTAIGTATYVGSVAMFSLQANRPLLSYTYSVPMRASATVTIYNPSTGAAGSCYSGDAATSYTVAIDTTGQKGFRAFASGTVATSGAAMHYTASAEL